MEYIKTIAALLFLPLAYCVVYFISEVHTKTYAKSPDGHWTASVREHRDASIFSSPEIFVTLQSDKTWMPLLRGEKILVIEEKAISQPQLKWRSSDELVITLTRKATDLPFEQQASIELTQYEGIKITYEILPP